MIKKIFIPIFLLIFSFSFSSISLYAEPVKREASKKKPVKKASQKNVTKSNAINPKEALATKVAKPNPKNNNKRFLNKVKNESIIPPQALAQLEFKCNENEPISCYYLAQYFLNKVVIDDISRKPYFKNTANLNHAEISENLNKAVKYLNFSCEEYIYEACSDLAKLNIEPNMNKYLYTKKDLSVSIDFLRRSCANNIASACSYLGDLSSDGKYQPKSLTQAFNYYHKGCSLQDSVACHNLALSYYKGWGVEVDHEEAFLYMDKACRMKNPEACKALKNP